MKVLQWIPVAAILGIFSAPSAAESNHVVISHYEPLQRLSMRSISETSAGSLQKAQGAAPIELGFDALGRSFDLQLEPNNELLSVESRQALPGGIDIYHGRLNGDPNSWARIVV
ncbi:MAG: hypothetical protein OEM51_06370, partial [Gammaproteobacteria bacterium]|nr:hypothetical protein [Gammaproteobacteria bacterium]